MKIYRIRPAYNSKGNSVFKDVVHKADGYDILLSQFEDGAPLDMVWNYGCKTKKLSDFILSSSPGQLFSERAMDKLLPLILNSKRYQVNLNDVNGCLTFHGVVVKGFKIGDVGMDHLLALCPKHGYPVVSEVFKRMWEKNEFTGMDFELIDDVDDSSFVAAQE